jgi:FAD binding domain
MTAQSISTQCCVTGGGPAGMMLGFLLARAGVDVVVLEKHGDFFGDFRGDTIHPSTLELMHELGLLDQFLALPHYKAERVRAQIGDTKITLADLTKLPTTCKFIAFMPQWDFLNFLAAHGRRYRGDGRHSTLRERAGFAVENLGARWTCCGCASRDIPMIPPMRSATSRPAAFSSCSTATITGSAPTSSPRARPTR